MKKIIIWIFITSCFLTQAFAETEQINKGKITVTGVAEIYAPANQIFLQIGAEIEGKTIEEAEKKGYETGIRIKNIFKKFGINEKSITQSEHKINFHRQNPYKEDSIKKPKFILEYTVIFSRFDLIDSLREKVIAAGVTKFEETGLQSTEITKYIKTLQKLMFQNAKSNAEAIINGSGYKLGLPLEVVSNNSYIPYDINYEGLGTVGVKGMEKMPLLRQKKIYLKDSIQITFQISK